MLPGARLESRLSLSLFSHPYSPNLVELDFSHLTEKGIDTLLTHPLKMR
jgi:hypothetical protein